jgi:hypothetical protein
MTPANTKLVSPLVGEGRFPALVFAGSLGEGDSLALAFEHH